MRIFTRKPAAAKLLTGYDLAQAEIAAGLVPSDPSYAIKHLDRELGNVVTVTDCTPACYDEGCSARTHRDSAPVAAYQPYTGRGYLADPFDQF